jgi:hypothetical protein
MSDTSQGPGWWQASDGRWYAPEQAPALEPTPPVPQATVSVPSATSTAGGSWASLSGPVKALIVGGTVLVVVIVGAAIAGGTSKKSSAKPPSDPNAAFISAVRSAAVGSLIKAAPDAQVVALGQGVCGKLASQSPGQVETSMLNAGKGQAFPEGDAATVIVAAGTHLCSTEAAAVSSWNREPSGQTAAASTQAPTTAPPTTVAPLTAPPPTTAPPIAPTTAASGAPPPPPVQPTCYPTADSGNCFKAGQYCPTADHGRTGVSSDGEPIKCEYNSGWRWERS